MNDENIKFSILSDDEYQKYAKNHPQKNFFQSLYMKELLIKENREVFLVGLKDNNKIICATLLASSCCFFKYKTYEALKGYLIDYNNFELVKLFTTKIIEFIKRHNGFRLIIDPYIIKQRRDIDGNIIDNKNNNLDVINNLLSIGFKSIDNAQVNLNFVLDINNKKCDELLKNMQSSTRNNINKTINKYKLVIEELNYDDLYIFKDITTNTSKRRNFKDRKLTYYQNMYKIFKNDIKVLISKLDCLKYLMTLKEENEKLLDKLNTLSDSTSNKKKKESIRKNIINNDKKIVEVTKLYAKNGRYIILSGAMFILYGDEIIYLFSGSYIEYMKYLGQYILQWEMIKYACNNNYKRYNFFGVKELNKDGKDYGVYEFKKGFNGHVEELLGAYEIKTNNIYYLFKLLSGIKKLFKK